MVWLDGKLRQRNREIKGNVTPHTGSHWRRKLKCIELLQQRNESSIQEVKGWGNRKIKRGKKRVLIIKGEETLGPRLCWLDKSPCQIINSINSFIFLHHVPCLNVLFKPNLVFCAPWNTRLYIHGSEAALPIAWRISPPLRRSSQWLH